MYDKDEFDFELVSHVGDVMKPNRDGSRGQRYMGAMEDNVTTVMPLVMTSQISEDEEEEHHHLSTHRELSPG